MINLIADIGTNVTAIWIAIIGCIGSIVASLFNTWKITKVEHHFNSRFDELITAAFARGVLQEKERRTEKDDNKSTKS